MKLFFTIEVVRLVVSVSLVLAEPVVCSAEFRSAVPVVALAVVSAVECLAATAYFCANRAYLAANFFGIRAGTAQKIPAWIYSKQGSLISSFQLFR